MRNIIKIDNNEVKEAVKVILNEFGHRDNLENVYQHNYNLNNLQLKEQSYGYVIAGNKANRRKYEVFVNECDLRRYGHRVSKYQVQLRKVSNSQSDLEEQKAIEEWLKSKGV